MTAPDGLEDLRAQIRAATEAAERLVRDVSAHATPAPARPHVPDSGWEPVRDETAAELHALADLLNSLRGLLPPELQGQLTDVLRQVLLALRAVIDWLVLRLERDAAERPSVELEDIPII